MNELERLLALDAALVACENIAGDMCVGMLQNQVEAKIDADYPEYGRFSDFGKFLAKQHDSVRKLADNPVIFGAD